MNGPAKDLVDVKNPYIDEFDRKKKKARKVEIRMKNFEPKIEKAQAVEEEEKKVSEAANLVEKCKHYEIKKSIIVEQVSQKTGGGALVGDMGDHLITHCSLVDDSFTDHVFEVIKTQVKSRRKRNLGYDSPSEGSDQQGDDEADNS